MKFYKKTDLITIAGILLVSLVSWVLFDIYSSNQSVKAEIYYYSQLVETVDLSKPVRHTFSIKENPNVIFQIDEDGGIAFIASDCPDKVCIKTGRLHRAGEYAACLPNGIILKIVAAGIPGDEDVDIIVGN